jgi:hypothetical protein
MIFPQRVARVAKPGGIIAAQGSTTFAFYNAAENPDA